LNSYDAIFIPGGGVRAGGALPEWVAARFDRALTLAGDALLIPLSAGTPHRPPPLDEWGFPLTEARAGAGYLIRHGVDPLRIVLEECSFDTIGHAYFSRVIHAIPRGLRRILVITSAFHMPRAEAVFRWVYGLDGSSYDLDFDMTPDAGIDPDALAARLHKERASLEALRPLVARIGSLAGLHAWLFSEHAVYAPGPRPAAAGADTRTY
jgi:uncharacterized SAM-binding protein YcdF (DUF218 family)